MAADRIVEDLDSNIYVVAGAGAGKTTALVSRICALITSGKYTVDRIVAITFTRAAASELRHRIIEELGNRQKDEKYDEDEKERMRVAQAHIFDASFSTIDSFCLGILNDYQAFTNLAPITSTGGDQFEIGRRFDVSWRNWTDRTLNDAAGNDFAQLVVRAARLGVHNTMRSLRETAQSLYDKYHLFANRTYTPPSKRPDQFAAMLAGKEKGLQVQIADYSGDTDDILYQHVEHHVLPLIKRLRENADDPAELDYLIAENHKISCRYGKQDNWAYTDGGKELVTGILEELKKVVEDERRFRKQDVTEQLLTELIKFAEGCAEERRLQGTLEFTDIILWTLKILKNHPQVRAKLRESYGTILVDEYQDTDPLQIELIELITALEEDERPQPGSLFVVGDPKQSIYSFRGASPATMSQSQDLFNMKQDKVVLEKNYRSLPQIVDWVDRLFNSWFSDQQTHIEDVEMESATRDMGLAGSVQVSGMNYSGGTHLTARRKHVSELARALNDPNFNVRLIAKTRRGVMLGIDETRRHTFSYLEANRVEEVLRDVPFVLVHGSDEKAKMLAECTKQLTHKDDRSFLQQEVECFGAEELAELAVKCGRGGLQVRDAGKRRSSKLGDMCVLVRKYKSLPAVERALKEYDVKYIVHGSNNIFADPTVNGVINLLEAMTDPIKQVALVGALKSYLFDCSDSDLLEWHSSGGQFDYSVPSDDAAVQAAPSVSDALSQIAEFRALSQTESVARLLEMIIQKCRLKTKIVLLHTNPEQVLQNLEVLVEYAFQQQSAGGSITEFVEWCLEMRATQARVDSPAGIGIRRSDAVNVMTVHAAKGLEFPIVAFLPSSTGNKQELVLSESSVRIAKDFETADYQEESDKNKQAMLEEESRVVYVAMTRARDHLFVGLHRTTKDTKGGLMEGLERHIPDDTPNRFMALPAYEARKPKPPEEKPPQAAQQDRAEWQRSLRDVIQSGSPEPVVVASGLNADLADTNVKRDADAPPPTGDQLGSRVGTAVHGVLETINFDADEEVIRKLVDKTLEEDLREHYERVVQMVMATLKQPLMVQAANSEICLRELPLSCALPSGQVLRCDLDLAFQDRDGNWIVVDYKTDTVGGDGGSERLLKKYQLQLAAYAFALQHTSGKRVSATYLLLCREAMEGRPAQFGLENLEESVRTFLAKVC